MPTDIEKVRIEVNDVDPTLPILPDATYTYLLEKNSNSIVRTAMDAARIILMNLSMRTDQTVDVFSIRNSKAAEQYRLALQLYLRDPNTNPVLQNCQGYFGGVSISDMEANELESDNNAVIAPNRERGSTATNYFEV